MAGIVVPDSGEVILLQWMLRTAFLIDEPVLYHLFVNNFQPNKQSVRADFVEPTFPGYDVVPVDRADWVFPTVVGGVASTFRNDGFISWMATSGPGESIFGYFVTDEDDAVVIWAEAFPAPQVVNTVNAVLVFPTMRLHSELEPEP